MRIDALDGLRGFAAFVVLLHHTFECLGGTIPSVIQGTLLVAAQQAVWLFFVLSGAVLTLQVQKQGFAAAYYLPSRLARLYLPTAAAVILAYGSILLVNRAIPTGNLWVDMHPQFLHLNALMSDLTLINGTSGNLMPLWSLKWEVLYSLVLLPTVFFVKKSPLWTALLAVLVGSLGIGEVVFYGAMFYSGTMVGLHWERICDWFETRALRANSVVLLAVALICVSNLLQRQDFGPVAGNIAIGLSQLSLPALVAALPWSVFSQAFTNALMLWLGKVSFSLYLVHEPILLAAARVGNLQPAAIALAGAGSLVGAWLFFTYIERRAHGLSRRIYNGPS